jgi:hypothetical protein
MRILSSATQVDRTNSNIIRIRNSRPLGIETILVSLLFQKANSRIGMAAQGRIEIEFTLLKSLREAAGRMLMWELAKPKPKAHNTKILRIGNTANCNKVPADTSK